MQVKLALFVAFGVGFVGSMQAGRAQRKGREKDLALVSPRGLASDSKQAEDLLSPDRVIKHPSQLNSYDEACLYKPNAYRGNPTVQQQYVARLIKDAVVIGKPLTVGQLKQKAHAK